MQVKTTEKTESLKHDPETYPQTKILGYSHVNSYFMLTCATSTSFSSPTLLSLQDFHIISIKLSTQSDLENPFDSLSKYISDRLLTIQMNTSTLTSAILFQSHRKILPLSYCPTPTSSSFSAQRNLPPKPIHSSPPSSKHQPTHKYPAQFNTPNAKSPQDLQPPPHSSSQMMSTD